MWRVEISSIQSCCREIWQRENLLLESKFLVLKQMEKCAPEIFFQWYLPFPRPRLWYIDNKEMSLIRQHISLLKRLPTSTLIYLLLKNFCHFQPFSRKWWKYSRWCEAELLLEWIVWNFRWKWRIGDKIVNFQWNVFLVFASPLFPLSLFSVSKYN